jgi:hypothetical protein
MPASRRQNILLLYLNKTGHGAREPIYWKIAPARRRRGMKKGKGGKLKKEKKEQIKENRGLMSENKRKIGGTVNANRECSEG